MRSPFTSEPSSRWIISLSPIPHTTLIAGRYRFSPRGFTRSSEEFDYLAAPSPNAHRLYKTLHGGKAPDIGRSHVRGGGNATSKQVELAMSDNVNSPGPDSGPNTPKSCRGP